MIAKIKSQSSVSSWIFQSIFSLQLIHIRANQTTEFLSLQINIFPLINLSLINIVLNQFGLSINIGYFKWSKQNKKEQIPSSQHLGLWVTKIVQLTCPFSFRSVCQGPHWALLHHVQDHQFWKPLKVPSLWVPVHLLTTLELMGPWSSWAPGAVSSQPCFFSARRLRTWIYYISPCAHADVKGALTPKMGLWLHALLHHEHLCTCRWVIAVPCPYPALCHPLPTANCTSCDLPVINASGSPHCHIAIANEPFIITIIYHNMVLIKISFVFSLLEFFFPLEGNFHSDEKKKQNKKSSTLGIVKVAIFQRRMTSLS